MLLLVAGFSSCQKDSFKPVNDESGKGKSTKVNVVQPTYTYADLALQPRQPGENFDTYKGIWSGQEVKVIGTPVWNQAAYPTLLNGIPATGASYDVYSNGNLITASTGVGQDFFALTVGVISGLEWGTKFREDLKKYETAVAAYDPSTSPPPVPSPGTFLPNTLYKDATSYTVTGKLIRVTTGSHWALATVDYPTPAPSNQVITNDISFIKDDIQYSLKTSGNTIIGVSLINGTTPPYTQIPAKGASGTCIAVDQENYNINVTIILTNGTVVNYQGAAWGGV